MFDAVIVGGGPGGLSGALVLGRCGRRVVVIDAGRGRNAKSRHLHNFLTRDGIAPGELRAAGRAELERYGVEFRADEAVDAARLMGGGFRIGLRGGEQLDGRKLLLATGVRDILPAIDGFDRFYGVSAHHCPYCDAWEHRGKRLIAWGLGSSAVGLALALRTWSEHVTACTEGAALTDEDRQRAAARSIAIREEPVRRLEGDGERVQRVVFAEGTPVECDAFFFNTGQVQRSDLPRRLGCAYKEDGGIKTTDRQCAGVYGLYVVGDADRDVQFAVVAAAEGATAAVAINRELQDEEVRAAMTR